MRSDTPSEGSDASAGDEVKKPITVKRNRSLRALRRRKAGDTPEEDSSFLEKLRNTMTDPEKQRRKNEKKKQKEEVS